MSDTETKTAVVGRSAAYPFIPLDKALTRAEELRKAVGRNDTRVDSAKHHWGYAAKSSGGSQTLAALIYFGLLEESGAGNDRRVKLSDLALRILLDQRPGSQERQELIRRAALTPKMHQELWNKWKGEPPIDAEIRHYLVLDRSFSENGARDLISEYRATLTYAGLLGSATVPPSEEDKMEADVSETAGQNKLSDSNTRREHIGPGMVAERKEIKDDFSVLLQGHKLKISATVDADGIARLKAVLDKYEEILKLLA